jgi:dTDP-4-dehydrorhamnose 3,5-epimerase
VRFVSTDLPGVLVIEPDVHRDARGFFLETFHQDKYREGGIPGPFVQDNHSLSAGGTVRGLHLQVGRRPQGKLVRVLDGVIYDVAVDVRRDRRPLVAGWAPGSRRTTSGRFTSCQGSHGVAVTSPTAQIEYKCTTWMTRRARSASRGTSPPLRSSGRCTSPGARCCPVATAAIRRSRP